MSNQEEYIRQLEQVISKFLEPLKGIPFPLAIKALTGFKVLTFEPSVEQNKKLLEQLSKAAQLGGKKAFEKGIFTARPNEAGNHIEPFVVDALKDAGLKADKPIAKSGKRKAAGYPDIQVEDEWNRTIYLDCKTYNHITPSKVMLRFISYPMPFRFKSER